MLTGNHKNIFNDARVPWSEYRYYDPKTVGLDFEGMIADIQVLEYLCQNMNCNPNISVCFAIFNWKNFVMWFFVQLGYTHKKLQSGNEQSPFLFATVNVLCVVIVCAVNLCVYSLQNRLPQKGHLFCYMVVLTIQLE
jgi:hypothetical protein